MKTVDSSLTDYNMQVYQSVLNLVKSYATKKKNVKEEHFILKPKKSSAIHHASYLWNRKINRCFKQKVYWFRFLRRVICNTIKSMDSYDIDIFSYVLKYHCGLVAFDLQHKDIVKKLTVLVESPENVIVLKNALKFWLEIAPILRTLGKIVPWRELLRSEAYLLTSDQLYQIYLDSR